MIRTTYAAIASAAALLAVGEAWDPPLAMADTVKDALCVLSHHDDANPRERAERKEGKRKERQLAKSTPARLSYLARRALLPNLRMVTPQGIQIKDLTVDYNSINLNGVAWPPEPLERINALVLGLEELPQSRADGVRLVRGCKAEAGTVTFCIRWAWDPVAKPSLTELLHQEDVNTPLDNTVRSASNTSPCF